jgi:hypothetical protein
MKEPNQAAQGMNAGNNIADSKAFSSRFVKTNIPNAVKLEPIEAQPT